MKTNTASPTQENEQFHVQQFAAVRAREYETAVNRLERFAQQAFPKETTYDGDMKHTYWFDEKGELQAERAPIDPHEQTELDKALDTIRDFEKDNPPYQEEIEQYYAHRAEDEVVRNNDEYDLDR